MTDNSDVDLAGAVATAELDADADASTGPGTDAASDTPPPRLPGTLEARAISAWFGDRKVLDRVSLTMPAGQVTALIGPSGCGKSTFLRILNRMHELVPVGHAGRRGPARRRGHLRPGSAASPRPARAIGMVFQKPNPFPAMSIYDNVTAGLKLTGTPRDRSEKDDLVESCLTKAGLWNEVSRPPATSPAAPSPAASSSACASPARWRCAREVLLMDEPCSALDPTSTRRIEETIGELASEVTIVIVTHNMQQAPPRLRPAAPSSWRRARHPGPHRGTRPDERDVRARRRTSGRRTTSTAASADTDAAAGHRYCPAAAEAIVSCAASVSARGSRRISRVPPEILAAC